MDLAQAIVLGLLQGVFEWLPVSSQGQVMGLGISFLGLTVESAKNYSIFLHIGTLFAAIVFFRKEIKRIISSRDVPLAKFLGIAVLATAITAIPSYLLLNAFSLLGIPALLFFIGIFLLITGYLQGRKQSQKKPGLSNKNAFFLGLGQGFSVLPGVSRSGTTVSVLLFEGFSPKEAFRLSFLLSIPSVLVAELAFSIFDPISIGLNEIVAVVSAFVFGLVSISVLLKLAEQISFSKFCYAFALLYFGIAFLAL